MSITVLHVTEACRIAGTERSLLMLLDHTDRAEFEHIVICRGAGGLAEEVARRNVRMAVIPRFGKLDPIAVIRFVHLLTKVKPDVVHICGGRLEAIAARVMGMPVVERKNVARNEFYRPLFGYRWADLLLNRFVNASIVPAAALESYYRGRGYRRADIRVIYNGVEPAPPRTPDDLAAKRAELGLRSSDFVVAFAGRLQPVKGIDVLLRAIASLPDSVRCVIAGDGPHRAEYEILAGKLGLTDRAIFTGYRTDVREIFACADVVAVPSAAEALANTTLEAMAEGKPVVSTSAAGQDEAIEHGVTGLLASPDDAPALAAALGLLAANLAEARSMGAAGRRKAETLLSPQRMARQTESIYRDLLHRQRNERICNVADCRQKAVQEDAAPRRPDQDEQVQQHALSAAGGDVHCRGAGGERVQRRSARRLARRPVGPADS